MDINLLWPVAGKGIIRWQIEEIPLFLLTSETTTPAIAGVVLHSPVGDITFG
ncbi:hypothetical protein [Sodalis praecaptivus]|uniref:hypothetical protein n=1 Tax=Sodalis TaxID=84565 RepID=UPI0004B747CC|nr:hypothetical protein [Sodalis praecaptivus]